MKSQVGKKKFCRLHTLLMLQLATASLICGLALILPSNLARAQTYQEARSIIFGRMSNEDDKWNDEIYDKIENKTVSRSEVLRTFSLAGGYRKKGDFFSASRLELTVRNAYFEMGWPADRVFVEASFYYATNDLMSLAAEPALFKAAHSAVEPLDSMLDTKGRGESGLIAIIYPEICIVQSALGQLATDDYPDWSKVGYFGKWIFELLPDIAAKARTGCNIVKNRYQRLIAETPDFLKSTCSSDNSKPIPPSAFQCPATPPAQVAVASEADDIYRKAYAALKSGDSAEAVSLFRKAADLGHAKSQYNLGTIYAEGKLVARNDAEAVRWYRKAAEQGEMYAQFNLGAMYAKGRGVTQNEAEAVSWIQKAAEQGDANAMTALGRIYQKKGDSVEAVRWYLKAAETGETGAMNDVAWFQATSPDHRIRDPRSAVIWAQKAVSSNSNIARRDTLAAAYAAAGRFDDAVREQSEVNALAKGTGTYNEGFETRLRLYQQHQALSCPNGPGC